MWPTVRNVTGILREPRPGTLVTGDACKLLKEDCTLNDARFMQNCTKLPETVAPVAWRPFNADFLMRIRLHNGSRDSSAANEGYSAHSVEVQPDNRRYGCGEGFEWASVVGAHYRPVLEMSDRLLDHPTDLVDVGVEFLLPV